MKKKREQFNNKPELSIVRWETGGKRGMNEGREKGMLRERGREEEREGNRKLRFLF